MAIAAVAFAGACIGQNTMQRDAAMCDRCAKLELTIERLRGALQRIIESGGTYSADIARAALERDPDFSEESIRRR